MDKNIYLDGRYLDKHPGWHAEDSPWKAAHIKGILDANNVTPITICEVGCGAGEILNQLAEYFEAPVELSGYEISPQAYELASQHASDRLRFFNNNVLEDDAANFELVLCIDVFEHVEDPFAFLRGLHEKCTWAVFHIPLDLSVQTVIRKGRILKNWDNAGHIHFYTQELALRLLSETGYEVIDHKYTAPSIERQTYSLLQACMKLPRRIAFALNADLAVRVLGGYSLLVLCKCSQACE